ncbi:hypothetical protein SCRES1_gp31 [Synechococcus phage S-CRES1]|nr:hypothetical protein SCRES1_gp31 [Synechococcus phage S-CRES1]
MINFFRNLLARLLPYRKPALKRFVITARRYSLPVNKQPVFSAFTLEARDKYEVARKFDTVYTRWTRLDVTEL